MERECVKIPLEKLAAILDVRYNYPKCKVRIYIDKENAEEIINKLAEYRDKARRVMMYILRCAYENDFYGKEKIDNSTKGLTAIKFKGRDNVRIYCKEYYHDEHGLNKSIVFIAVYNKKTQKIDKKLKSFLKKISKYEYKIE